MATYTIEVYTDSEPDSDTNAKVHIQLFGPSSHGDSGQRMLYKAINGNKAKFRQGQCDIFQIQGVTLSNIEKVIMGHYEDEEGK